MARSVNKVILVGNVTRKPEVRYTQSGTPVTSFGLATNSSWKGKDGEQHDDVEFHNLTAWNKLAEVCGEWLTKGQQIYIEGKLKYGTYEKDDGSTQNKTDIIIETMVMLGGKKEEGEEEQPRKKAPATKKVATPTKSLPGKNFPDDVDEVEDVSEEVEEFNDDGSNPTHGKPPWEK